MSSFIATVSQIQRCDSLHIVKFDFMGEVLSMMSLELNDKIQVGTKVKLVAKPTHIAIAKKFSGDISYSNQLKCTIKSIKNGELLSSIKLEISGIVLESIITVASSKRLDLNVDDTVTAFIKASELSIRELMDD